MDPQRLKKKAMQSHHNFRHAAALVSTGKTQYGFNRGTVHAEMTVARKMRRNKTYDLYVCRLSAKDEFVYSKPCDRCVSTLKNLRQLRYIYYTNYDGEFAVLSL